MKEERMQMVGAPDHVSGDFALAEGFGVSY